jgi:hypothetical protein
MCDVCVTLGAVQETVSAALNCAAEVKDEPSTSCQTSAASGVLRGREGWVGGPKEENAETGGAEDGTEAEEEGGRGGEEPPKV